MEDTKTAKEEFLELLRSTGREGVEGVIEDLEEQGFFTAPASAGHHLNTEGGLVEHSLNTAKAALAVWEGMKQLDASLETEVTRDSVIIASLLHDVCKSDIYFRSIKKRKPPRTVGRLRRLQGELQELSYGTRREIGDSRSAQRTGTYRCRDARHALAHGRMGRQHDKF
ncbi:MAG: hypothetical protein L6U61_06975 [Bacteroidales bacterium]|nr:MAG: hypothetical protein L6U61_06975 [Bacteroidales bacterium]